MRRTIPFLLAALFVGCGDRENKPVTPPLPPTETPAEASPPEETPEAPAVASPPSSSDPDAIDLDTFVTLMNSDQVDDRERAIYRLRVDFERDDLAADVARLLPLLEGALRDESGSVRRGAVDGLGRLGPLATNQLGALLPLLEDRNPGVRARTASAIGAIGAGPPAAIDALVATLADDFEAVRINVLMALTRARPLPERLGKVVSRLLREDESDEVRAQAALLLGELPAADEHVRTQLTAALGDANAEVRAAAAWALGALGSPSNEALTKLDALLRDGAIEVREAARVALERLSEDDG